MDPHRLSEERSIALHKRVGELLLQNPEVLARAKAKLDEWSESKAMHPHYVDAWRRAFALPLSQLVALLVSRDEHATAMRQASPFAGALAPKERWAILREVKRSAT